MKNILLITFIIIDSLSAFSQTKNEIPKLRIIKIHGFISSVAMNDSLPLAIVELMNCNHEPIKLVTSDMDGRYFIKFCSSLLINDTLLIKTTKAFYKQEISYFKINSDTAITICMTSDTDRSITKEKFEKYKSQFPICGPMRLFDAEGARDCDCKKNYTYTHYCTGEKKR